MVNIIPMAGLGSRFSDAGYLLPKPLIPVSGKPMITNVIAHMPKADKWIFIVRKEHVEQFALDEVIKSALPDALIIPIEETTDGQATTCMLAMPFVSDEDEIFIAACDNSFLYDEAKFAALRARRDVDAIIWSFTKDPLLSAKPEAWGWLKLESDGETIEDVSVKIPISKTPENDHAVVATFYFKRAADFKAAYAAMRDANHRINNEFYIDALPIFMKQQGKKSVLFDVELYVGWGKPSDLYHYELKEHEYTTNTLGRDAQSSLWNKFFKKWLKI